VAGEFTIAGGVAANNIARWNGSAWAPFGSGLTGVATPRGHTLMTLPNGDLVVGGEFTVVDGVEATSIARWDGASWSPFGSGLLAGADSGQVFALTTMQNGDLVAAGWFSSAGGVSANRIARWDGNAWAALGSGMNYPVRALATLPNGDVVAGGDFNVADGAVVRCVARWDGGQWWPMGTGMLSSLQTAAVYAVTALPNGDVMAGGSFSGGGPGNFELSAIARWDGTAWRPTASMIGLVRALTPLPNGDFVAGGEFTEAGGAIVNRIARWYGMSWSPLGSGVNLAVLAMATLPNGNVVAGGTFTTAGGVAANSIAQWDGSVWSPLGAGTDGPVKSLFALPNGDLIVGGSFTTAGGVAANRIARWDGAVWAPLGAGTNGDVLAIAILPGGAVSSAAATSREPPRVTQDFDRYSRSRPRLMMVFWISLVPSPISRNGASRMSRSISYSLE
jgi:hypothetical protein